MDPIHNQPEAEPAPVQRVRSALASHGHPAAIRALPTSGRTAREAADGLGIASGQIASSIIFGLQTQAGIGPLLVVTSGAHRVDTDHVAGLLGVPALLRADADQVRSWTGFAIGGVSPIGWQAETASIPAPVVLVDEDLAQWEQVWAAAGHPNYVFPTSFLNLVKMTQGTPAKVGE
jgi:prolyl-tRNA editing enzyme YbaK/EbsC (Cys-tRNA(Pro) deacylase)